MHFKINFRCLLLAVFCISGCKQNNSNDIAKGEVAEHSLSLDENDLFILNKVKDETNKISTKDQRIESYENLLEGHGIVVSEKFIMKQDNNILVIFADKKKLAEISQFLNYYGSLSESELKSAVKLFIEDTD